MPLTSLLPRTGTAQALLLLLVPHGGQGHARRNAWAGMSADAALGRDWRQAEAAVRTAATRAYAREVLQGGTGA